MKDINGVELEGKDQVEINTEDELFRKGDLQEISVQNGKYFLVGLTKIALTKEVIKKYKITFFRRITTPEILIKW